MKQIICIKNRKECHSILNHTLNQLPFVIKATPLNSFLWLIDYDHTKINESTLLLSIEKSTLDYQVLDFNKNSSAITWIISLLLFITHIIGIMLMPTIWTLPMIGIIVLSFINLSVYWINYFYRISHFKLSFKDGLNCLQLLFLINALLTSSSIFQYQYGSIFLGLCIVAASENMVNQYIHYQTLKPFVAYIKAINEPLTIKTGNDFLPIHPLSIKMNDIVAYKKGSIIVTDGCVVNGNATLNGTLNQDNTMHAHKDSTITSGYKVIDGYIEVKVNNVVEDSYVSKLYQSYKNSLCQPDLTLLNLQINQVFYVVLAYVIALGITAITYLIPQLKFDSFLWIQIASFFIYLNHLLCNANLYRNSIYTSFKNHTLVKNAACIGEKSKYDQIWIPRIPYLWRKYKINDVIVSNTIDQTTFNHILYSIHKRKNDTLSIAIHDYLRLQNIKDTNLSLTKSIFAKGIETILKGSKVCAYSIEQCQTNNVDLSAFKGILEQYEDEGKLIHLYVKDNQVIGIVTLVDVIDNNAKNTLSLLQGNGIKCILLDDLSDAHRLNFTKQYQMDGSYNIYDHEKYINALNTAQFINNESIITICNTITTPNYSAYADISINLDINADSDIIILDGQLSTLAAWLSFKSDWVNLSTRLASFTRYLPTVITTIFVLITLLFHPFMSLDFYGLLYLLTLFASILLRFRVEHKLMHLQYVETYIPENKTLQIVIEDCISDYDITQVRQALSIFKQCRLSFDLQQRLATITLNSDTSIEKVEQAIVNAGYKIKR